jgi:gliding motility-associated-like protein
MHKKNKYRFLTILFFTCFNHLFAQYTVNGDAFREGCRCYTLTPNINGQRGSVWNNNLINLNQSFDFTFQVFLGCTDNNGADGMAFVLQPISVTVGGNGGGMGFGTINPSVGVTMDTYQNADPDFDPFYDHIAIQLNGDVVHNSVNTLTPLTPISSTNSNVEDCQNHSLRIVWNAVSKTMSVFFDNQPRVSATRDFVNTVFSGNPLVYWGFTAATGGLSNLHKFCTPLSPGFNFAPTQRRCVGDSITFFDSTTSFTNVVKWYWNFADGSDIDSINVNPTHVYTTAGIYFVTYRVVSLDGCEETFTRQVNIGTKPIASFTYNDSCLSNTIQFNSTSTSGTGGINSWYWNLDNGGPASNISNPTASYNTIGPKTIQLVVGTTEGCTSDTLVQNIRILPRSTSDFTFTDSVCVGNPTVFTDQSQLLGGAVNFWQWTSSDPGFNSSVQNPTHLFSTPGSYTVSLTTSGNGSTSCLGNTITKTIFVVDKPMADFFDVIPCEAQAITLNDSSYTTDGQTISSCWWGFGNGQFSNACNPVFTFPSSGLYPIQHVVVNQRGCVSDTMNVSITIADKPTPDFTLSPVICGDSTLVFTDISTMQYGQSAQWNWIYNNNTFSSVNPARGFFPFGNQQVGLVVTSSNGCFSDTVFKSFKLVRKPKIDFDFQDTCKFDPVYFSAQETGVPANITQWVWNLGDGTSASSTSFTHLYLANGAYPVTLYAISADGCSSDTLRDVVNIYGTNAFAGNDTIASAGQPVQLQASGGISYTWSPSDGLSNTNISNPTAVVYEDKTYYLKAFTPGGCPSYDTINIIIYKGPDFYMPTAFTPNGDGLNDVLKPFLVGVKRFDHFIVYNRYGQQIFYTTRRGFGWDGSLNGRKQPIGTYVWQISGEDYTGKKMFKKGTVLLLQ